MKQFTADFLFDGYKIREQYGLTFDDKNQIVAMASATEMPDARHVSGLIMPGFINAHCHLELSHLYNKVPTGTGLLEFLKQVVKFRAVDQDIIQQAIADQDTFMWNQGIQAVGDISNTLDTLACKTSSPIRYYTFVEMFDLMQNQMTDSSFAQYQQVHAGYNQASGNNFSAVPHAPYSVTAALFKRINTLNNEAKTISIHNQETPAENQYFQDKSGDFTAFYQSLGLDDTDFQPMGTNSIQYAMQHMDSNHKTLFVHNTMTTAEDIQAALAWNSESYWASCPNANLYIENRLPDYRTFMDTKAKVCIGTDSLTSNWQLSILDEIKTIQRYNSYVPIEDLLKWATIHGAKALSFDDKLGSLEIGKRPGLIQLQEFSLDSIQACTVNRLVG